MAAFQGEEFITMVLMISEFDASIKATEIKIGAPAQTCGQNNRVFNKGVGVFKSLKEKGA